mgnify:CR=1 FL=1
MSKAISSRLFNKIASGALDDIFNQVYETWGGDKRIDEQIATDIMVPIFTSYRRKSLLRKVNAVLGRQEELPLDRKSTRLNSSHIPLSRMPSSA